MVRWTLAVVAVWGVAMTGVRAVRAAYTAEGLAAESAVIYRGRVEKVEVTADALGLLTTTMAEVVPVEVIRGEARPGKVEMGGDSSGPAVAVGDEVAVCEGDGGQVLACVALRPGALATRLNYFPEPVMTPTVVTLAAEPMTGGAVLAVLRVEAKRDRERTVAVQTGGAPVRLQPWELVIPVDERLEGIAEGLARSPRPVARMLAVGLCAASASPNLGIFKPPAPQVPLDIPGRARILRSLLADEWVVDQVNRVSPFEPRVYPVREGAVRVLATLGEPVAGVVTEAPNTMYRRVHFAWPVLVLVAVSVGVYVVARRRRWPVPWALAWCPVLAVLLVGWHRSRWVGDDFFWASRPYLLSVTSCDQGVQVMWSAEGMGNAGLSHAAMMPDLVNDAVALWDRSFWHGFGDGSLGSRPRPVGAVRFKRSEMGDPAVASAWRSMEVGVLVVPYRDLVAAVVGIAGVSVVPLMWRYWRRRASRRAGLCAACGFDVRVQVAGERGGRCPECGAGVG